MTKLAWPWQDALAESNSRNMPLKWSLFPLFHDWSSTGLVCSLIYLLQTPESDLDDTILVTLLGGDR